MSLGRAWLVNSCPRVATCAIAAFVGYSWNLASVHAESAVARVDCPQLSGEQSAELEARAQATLLTTDVMARVVILCHDGGAEVRVEAGDEQVSVQARATRATLRDEVQRALDEALSELRSRRAVVPIVPDRTPASPPPASTGGVATAGPAARPPAVSVSPRPPPRALASPETRRLASGISASILAETWSERVAVGGAARGALAVEPGLEFALRLGFFHPLGLKRFSANEAHLVVDATLEPSFAGGLRLSLGVGASVLFVTPDTSLGTAQGAARAALRAEVRVGRAFHWGKIQFLPSAALYGFGAERGVRVDARERLVLVGVGPQLSLALGYRH